ncbi:MAG: hypothetical protein H6739_37010 [Alphaproteobacteria bacterium]|nr:hypothetical protein [Alphaproteobacteria bacterium]
MSEDATALRQAVYGGARRVLPPGDASRALVAAVWAVVEAALGPDPRRVHERLTTPALLDRLAEARAALRAEPFRGLVHAVMRAAGQAPEACAVDLLRLRAVTPGGWRAPGAAVAWSVHRDTWYANPRAQLNWWIPLHDVSARDGLRFLPASFGFPVENDSARFDYDVFMRQAGWQARQGGAVYPHATGPEAEADGVGQGMAAAAVLLFSADQLHRSPRFDGPLTRLSVDFRSVHRADRAAGLGAPGVDARCTGDASKDYPW